MREQPGLKPLAQLIDGFPPAVLDEAATVLALDIDRVLDGLDITEVDHIYMQPVRNLEDLSFVQPGVVPHPEGTEFEVIDADPRRIKRLRVRLPGQAAE